MAEEVGPSRPAVKSPHGVRGVAVTGKLEPDIFRQSTTTQTSMGRGL